MSNAASSKRNDDDFADSPRADSNSPSAASTSRELKSNHSISPGTNLGRYCVLDRLGSGGMGDVYLAWDSELARNVAIKILRPETIELQGRGDGQAVTQLLEEARALAQLRHESVVPVYEVGRVDDIVYLVMERLVGQTWDGWARSEKRSWAACIRIAIQAARGLSSAHRAGWLHLDVKPQNIMVCDDGRVCILDFGLANRVTERDSKRSQDFSSRSSISGLSSGARSVSDSDVENQSAPYGSTTSIVLDAATDFIEGEVAGTPAYMAPEQYLQGRVTAHADQFSFAVSLYELLSGSRPYKGRSYRELARAITSGRRHTASWPPSIPRRIRPILDRALALQSRQRFQTMDRMIEELELVLHAHENRWMRRSIWSTAVCSLLGFGWMINEESTQGVCDVENASDWTEPVRASFQSKIAAGGPRGESVVVRILPQADSWFERWAEAKRELCEARSELQDVRRWDAQQQCLDRQHHEVWGILRAIRNATSVDLNAIERAFFDLPRLDSCFSQNVVEQNAVSPPPAKIAKQVAALHSELDDISATHRAGNFREAVRQCQVRLDAIKKVDYLPLQIRADLVCAGGFSQLDDPRPAVRILWNAYYLAIQAHQGVEAADALVRLTEIYGYRLEQAQFARDDLLPFAFAQTGRLSGTHPELTWELRRTASIIYAVLGDGSTAFDYFKKTAADAPVLFGEIDFRTMESISNLGAVYLTLFENPKRALPYFNRSLKIHRQIFGYRASGELVMQGNILGIARRLGDFELAQKHIDWIIFQDRPESIAPEQGAFYWAQIFWYYRHRAQYDLAHNFTIRFLDWLSVYSSEVSQLTPFARGLQLLLDVERGQYSAIPDLRENFDSYARKLRGVPTAIDNWANIVLTTAYRCQGESEQAREIFRPHVEPALRFRGGERAISWEYMGYHVANRWAIENWDIAEYLEAFDQESASVTGDEHRFGWTRAWLIWSRLAAIAGDEARAQRWLERVNTVLVQKLPRDDAQFVEFTRESNRVQRWIQQYKAGQTPEPEDLTCPHRGSVD